MMILLALTWKVKLKGGPITPGSSRDSSDLMSYRVGFESLFEVKNKQEQWICEKQLPSIYLAFKARAVNICDNKDPVPATVSATHFPTLILLLFQTPQNPFVPVTCTQAHCFQNHLKSFGNMRGLVIWTLRNWRTWWREGPPRISVSNRYRWSYRLCSFPRRRCWEETRNI